MKKYKNRGITLIALVVTIVVLLILAGVSISMLAGDNGIITRARKAKNAHDESSANETTKMEETVDKINKYDPNGGSTSDDDKITLPEGWDGNKVNPVKSADDIVVPVPKGYVSSTVENENKVSTGFVIKEGSDGGATEGINEFVWVPVENISDIYDEANNAGQLWDFSGTTSTRKTYPTKQNIDYREPDVVTGAKEGSNSTSGKEADAVSANLQQAGLLSTATVSDFKAQLQREFNDMIDSVRTYGGFYIGRYETGNLSKTKAVVQKNNSDIESQTWYTMYKLCKTIKANDNVTTSMIWGCQWDVTLRWMQTSTDSEVANFPTNSKGKGNYTGTQGDTDQTIPTGSNSAYAVNNIYDMAGNVLDWTIEIYTSLYRVERGGYCFYTPPIYSANYRYLDEPTKSYNYNGCRSTLYIN